MPRREQIATQCFSNSIIKFVAFVLLQGKPVKIQLLRCTQLFSGEVQRLNKVCESNRILQVSAYSGRNKTTSKNKDNKNTRLFSQFEYFLNVFTYAVTERTSVAISLFEFIASCHIKIVNIYCNIYRDYSDSRMTVLLNSTEWQERIARVVNIGSTNENSAITEKREKVSSSR